MTNGIGRFGVRQYVSPLPSPLWDNLTHYYSADNTTNDAKVTYNGTLVNGATYSTGKIGSAFSFDGINDYVNFPNDFFKPVSNFSANFWINTNNATTEQTIFTSVASNGYLGWRLFISGGVVTFRTFPINTQIHGLSTSASKYTASNWYMITVINDISNGMNIYVNGTLAASNTIKQAISWGSTTINRLGQNWDNGTVFNGKIDDVAIWSKALNSTEVTELYNAGAGKQYVAPVEASIVSSGLIMNLDAKNALSYSGTGTTWTDLSGNGNNGTLYNGTSYNSTNGGTIVFDGVNDYVKINTGLPVSGNTLSLWFKQSSSKGAGLITTSLANGGSPHLLVDLGADYLRTYNEGGGWFSPNSAYTPTNWYNVTITGTSTVRNIYMNGVLTATKNNSVFGYNTEIIIGTGYNGYFNGNVPVVHLYNRVLTQAEITANFNALKGRFGL